MSFCIAGATYSNFCSQFDPAIQRYLSTLAHMEDYYKATPKTVTYGLGVLFVPMGIIAYFLKRDKVLHH